MSTEEEKPTTPAEDSPAEEEKDLKSSVKKNASVINAAQASVAIKQATKAEDVTAYVKITKAVLDFQIMELMAQKQLLDDLSSMTDDEKKETLFYLLDKDDDGHLDAVELADGLRKVRGDINFEESLALGIERVLQFDKEGQGKLNLEDFGTFLDTLSEVLGSNFHELSELFVMQVMFSETGNDDLENVAGELVKGEVTEAIKQEEAMQKAATGARMKALFDLFDADGSGSVDFKEAALGMFKITEDMEGAGKAAVLALLMFDDEGDRSLNFEEFGRFMIQIVAAAPEGYSFDDIADEMTKAVAEDAEVSDEEIQALYELNEKVQALIDEKESHEQLVEVTESQIRKCNSLFFLWDTDEDGSLDLKELILGLRKFEQTKSMDTTVEEAIELMQAYDLDGDYTLDPAEFCLFMVDFCKLSGTSLEDTLDFMIVTSALEENSEAEMKYFKALEEEDVVHL